MEKIIRTCLIVTVCLLLAASVFLAIDMAGLRQTIAGLEDRNRNLVLSNSQYGSVLDSIGSRISEAQKTLTGTGDTISRIRGLVDAIERISQDLRKLTPQGASP